MQRSEDDIKAKSRDLIELERPPIIEKAILVRLALPADTDEEVEESLEELGQLAWTAGADVVCTFVQHRPKPCPATLIGAGKAADIKAAVDEMGAELVICLPSSAPRKA
jgi:GTPase